MRDMEERLLSRFKWGLQAALNTPDYEHRLRILKAKLLRDDINIPDDVVCYVAKSVNTNVRELEGVGQFLIASIDIGTQGDNSRTLLSNWFPSS